MGVFWPSGRLPRVSGHLAMVRWCLLLMRLNVNMDQWKIFYYI